MGKFKKYILEAIKDELELLGTVSSLLQQLTHRYVAEQKKLFRKKNAKNDKEYQNILSKSDFKQFNILPLIGNPAWKTSSLAFITEPRADFPSQI